MNWEEKQMKKRIALVLALVLSITLLASCAGTSNKPAEEQVQETKTSIADPNDMSSLQVCAIFTGPRGDSGTIDMACNALEKLADETGLQIEIIEGDNSGDMAKLEAAVLDVSDDGYDMILSTGTMSDVFRSVAPEYPEITYALFDTTFDFTTYEGENIYCANFLQNEGAYLAGMLAMSMSESDVIGFVGGMENANICDFMWGYVEGAKAVNPAGKVAISFTGDWMDSAKAKEITLTQVGMGADVVFPASGPSQEGAYEGAAEAGIYSIGVDIDREKQYAQSNPDWAYCYWGISPQDLTRLEDLKKGELKLRTTVVRNGVNESFDIPVSIEDSEWTVSLPSDGGECYVSLIVDAAGEDLELAHSSRIKLAQSYWLEHKEEIKDNDNLFKIYLSLLTTKEGYVAENSLVDEILQFAEGGENE